MNLLNVPPYLQLVEIGVIAVLALLGDNGAGKPTLIKILSGVVQPDKGEIRIEGDRVEIDSPHKARELGIETVYGMAEKGVEEAVAKLHGKPVKRNVNTGAKLITPQNARKYFNQVRDKLGHTGRGLGASR